MYSNKKIYEKPALDVAIFSSDEIMATSGGLINGNFTKIADGKNNNVNVENLE